MPSDDKDDIVREVVRLAEFNLKAQLTLMVAADQRATTFSGMIIGALAVIATSYDKNSRIWTDDVGIMILGVAAIMAVYSARSVKSSVMGNEFDLFLSKLDSSRDVPSVLADLTRIFETASRTNLATMRRNAKFYNSALAWSVIGFLISLTPNLLSIFTKLQNFVTSLGG